MNGMGKKLITVVLAALPGAGLPVQAESERRDVSDFDRVVFALPGSLTLERAEGFEVVIDAVPDDLERIQTVVRGDTLHIGWKEGLFGVLGGRPAGDAIRVQVSLPALEALELAGSGDADGGSWLSETFALEVNGSGNAAFEEISAEELTIEVSGSGGVEVVKVDAGALRLDVMGSGDVVLSGAADRQNIEVMGSGDVEAAELEGARVEVEIMGSGDVSVWAQESLSARIMGSGDVRYRGQPQVDRREHGSGDVRAL